VIDVGLHPGQGVYVRPYENMVYDAAIFYSEIAETLTLYSADEVPPILTSFAQQMTRHLLL
jgi:hypothetical protein